MYEPHLSYEPMTKKWNKRFIQLAEHVANWSKDPSTQVGALIVDSGRNVRAMGYNGFPEGVEDTAVRLEDRTQKYPLVVHAELNALGECAELGISTKGAILVCTHMPCANCAGPLVKAGIREWVIKAPSADFKDRWKEEYKFSEIIIRESKIRLTIVE
jgi:dCMP deaminase